ncbi:MAG: Alanine--tRNA ligase [Firmicutes bacterium ADurb.Bin193]|nr:MAG: Alanine--tRNA ligase [Firmicutes bacterium ADurb.Bin193]
MEKMGLNEIRERFLRFFEGKGHLRLPSFPLVPQGDNSLLLINAGMAPLKPYFTGKEVPPSKRVTTCQRCIRTPDIERVGKTARHGTYFEMLGNFSFGDYFKREATAWAWEFVTKEMKMPVERLWVSIFEEDDEAAEIWTKEVGVAPDRIVRLGREDNFWEIGLGPCGPCSEIYFDRGEDKGCGRADCAVGCDCDRFVEFWNLVFTQFDKDEQGNYNRLANPNIDTGMGMERLAAIMQGVNSLFEVDTVRNIMLCVCRIAGVNYGDNEQSDISLRIITDHIRGSAFMISDGIIPSNEGRGYVLRRLLRRAARHGKLLGIKRTFLHEVIGAVVAENKTAYPELAEKEDYIKKIVKNEEESFDNTIDSGLSILHDYISETISSGGKILSGDKAFKLYDTYGFPIDLTIEILQENKLEVDMKGFEALMNEQRERARAARSDSGEAGWDGGVFGLLGSGATEFIGYENSECDSTVVAIIRDNELSESLNKGDEGFAELDKTVFYGESGGQVGDEGVIEFEGGRAIVTDTKKLAGGKIVHAVRVESGGLKVGTSVHAKIDVRKRKGVCANHSATHLLQKALINTLGGHVAQSGSYVSGDYLRFDFTHFSPVTEDELLKTEDEVNSAILDSLNVNISYKSIDEAKKDGAIALFGEKYGSTVRVVKMGDYSTELCGGCHVGNTSQIGLFKIIKESGVAAGIRRIEAVTGESVLKLLRERERVLKEASVLLKTSPSDVTARIETFLEEYKCAGKEIEALKSRLAGSSVDDFIKGAKMAGETSVISGRMDGLNLGGLRNLGDRIRDKVQNAVVVLASVKDGKIGFIAMATKAAVAAGADSGRIVREVAKITGGGGGGKPDSAQAGGTDLSKVDDAVAEVYNIVKEQMRTN